MSKEMVWTTDSWILPLTTSPLSPAKKSAPTTWVLARVFAANVAARWGENEGFQSSPSWSVFFFPMAFFLVVGELQFGDLNVELVIGKNMDYGFANGIQILRNRQILYQCFWYQYMVCLKKYVSRPVRFVPVSVRQWSRFATWKTLRLRKACLGRFFAQQLQWKGIVGNLNSLPETNTKSTWK